IPLSGAADARPPVARRPCRASKHGARRAMKCYFIPIEDDAFVVYRPLVPMAFIANGAMKRFIEGGRETGSRGGQQAWSWLDEIGFGAPDTPLEAHLPKNAAAPHTAVLMMTNTCNLKCTYCYADAGVRHAKSMSVAIGERLIRQAAQNA